MLFYNTVSQIIITIIITFGIVRGASLKPKFVKFDLEHTNNEELLKRGYDEVQLSDKYTYYLTTVKVGKNQQSVQLLVDTGSSDMFVIDSAACPACTLGTFTKSQSSTYKPLNFAYTEYYGSGKATGTWGKDTVSVGSASVSQQQFAIASTYPANFGVFGVGYSPDVIPQTPSYSNFPKNLKTTGLINKVAFSFYAGNFGKNKGHLLFGAVDMGKVSGGLTKVAMVNTDTTHFAHPHTPTLKLTGVTLDSTYSSIKSKSLSTASVNMLVDTGTSFTLIPTAAFNGLVSSLSAKKTNGQYYIDCGLLNKNINVTMSFSGAKITTPLTDLVYQTSSTQCMLGVQGSDSQFILGANAMRAAYIVFDYEDYAIYIGAATANAATENIKVITSSVPTN